MADFASSIRELPPEPEPDGPNLEVVVDAGDDSRATIDPVTGATVIEQPDGAVVIDFRGPNAGREDKTGADAHDANLAEYLEPGQLGTIAEDLILGIEADDQSRKEWKDSMARAIDMLGVKLESPRSGMSDGAPLEGMSVVKSPLLLEAVLRFQANARAELLPAAGPVKVRDDTVSKTAAQKQKEAAAGQQPAPAPAADADTLPQALQTELNRYLTTTAREYYPDTNRMLFWVGLGGSGFKKVYRCPLRRRPVSEAIIADDLIVSNDATDLHSAGRVTHRTKMRQSVMKRMQLAGHYLDAALAPPTQQETDAVEQKEQEVVGIVPANQLPSDHQHTLYECYCELDLPGFEHREDDELTGLPLPYRVTIEKDSRQILEIRRNWGEDDERFHARMPIVKYGFVDGIGFYNLGLLHILGNSTAAVTASWRMALDAGMFASFPGGFIPKGAGRAGKKTIRLGPGEWEQIDTNGMASLSDAVMPLPYRDASAGLLAMMQHIEEASGRVGGIAEIEVGEGRQDAPVGTTLALLDQATKVMAAVHKGLHQSQSEEFELLRELFREDPEPLLGPNLPHEREHIIKALKDFNLVPAADPNTPSQTHRFLRAQALKTLQQQNPMMDAQAVDKRILIMLGEPDPDALFLPPAPPGPDPATVQMEFFKAIEDGKRMVEMEEVKARLATTEANTKVALAKLEQEAKDNANDRELQAQIAEKKDEIERLKLQQRAIVEAGKLAATRRGQDGKAEESRAKATAQKPERRF